VKLAAAALVVACGCNRGSKPAEPEPVPDCAHVIAALRRGDGAKAAGSAVVERVTAAMQASCDQDGWPDAVRRCVVAAKTEAEIRRCNEQLPKDVKDKLAKRLIGDGFK
jgi:hypothetical protein